MSPQSVAGYKFEWEYRGCCEKRALDPKGGARVVIIVGSEGK